MEKRNTVKFGVVGCGLMGREFASAAARWCHLAADLPRPEIVAVCDLNESARAWFTDNFSSVHLSTSDLGELLADPEVEAVYCAVPHNLHEKFYTAIINSDKHLMGEKPFGIDLAANRAIVNAIKTHPGKIVRCSSEFPYYPAAQELIKKITEGKFGKLIEVRSSFCHSSDMDTQKPINWKRRIETNGEYGCMGDLGLHTEHLPFRMGWIPESVYANLSKIITRRPDGHGGYADCLTWDNARLDCRVPATADISRCILRPNAFAPALPTDGASKLTDLIIPHAFLRTIPARSGTRKRSDVSRHGAVSMSDISR